MFRFFSLLGTFLINCIFLKIAHSCVFNFIYIKFKVSHDFKYSLSFLVLFICDSVFVDSPCSRSVWIYLYVLLFPIGFVNLFILVYFVFELHLEVFVF